MMHKYLCILLLVTLGAWSSHLNAAVSGGASPVGPSVTIPHLDEASLMSVLGQGALSNCFLSSIRVAGVDSCTIGYIPMVCMRMRNNYPSNILEGSYKHQHMSVTTVAGLAQINSMGESASLGKKLMARAGTGDSSHGGSYVAMARTQALPIATSTIFSVARGVSLGNLCAPNVFGAGYLFLSDAAEKSFGFSSWRPVVSAYWLHGMTAGLTGLAKGLELTGFCGLDYFHIVCYGGYGTVFPGNGLNPAASPMMNLLISAWRAQEIHAPALPTHGLYGTSLGASVWMLHDPRTFAYGAAAQVPKYSLGGYVQWLYPDTTSTGTGDTNCYTIGIGSGTVPAFFTQMASELLNRIPLGDMVLSFAYWSRWTCCNYCSASNESAVRQLIPENSFNATLSRMP